MTRVVCFDGPADGLEEDWATDPDWFVWDDGTLYRAVDEWRDGTVVYFEEAAALRLGLVDAAL